jgi:hypothetical protein
VFRVPYYVSDADYTKYALRDTLERGLVYEERIMLVAVGGICLGLVWGWIAARMVYRATRWTVVASALLGTAGLGLVVALVAAPWVTRWFALGVLLGALVCLVWVRTLELRYR